MQISTKRNFKLDPKNLYFGSCTDKGAAVDLYYNKKLNYYIGRYGEEAENYTAVDTIVADREDMVGHILRIAYNYHKNMD